MKRGEAKAGVALPANVRFDDAADSHQHDLGSILPRDRGIRKPITVDVF